MAEVFAAYEQVKRAGGVIDFEDLLRAAVWGIEEHPDVAEQIRAQYRHFVVDEYQDVNPSAAAAARRVARRPGRPDRGRRREPDDLLVHRCLVALPGRRSPATTGAPRSVRLVRDYRSTPQVVGLANAIIRQARGDEARLRLELVGQRPPGPEPELRMLPDEPAEAAGGGRRAVPS